MSSRAVRIKADVRWTYAWKLRCTTPMKHWWDSLENSVDRFKLNTSSLWPVADSCSRSSLVGTGCIFQPKSSHLLTVRGWCYARGYQELCPSSQATSHRIWSLKNPKRLPGVTNNGTPIVFPVVTLPSCVKCFCYIQGLMGFTGETDEFTGLSIYLVGRILLNLYIGAQRYLECKYLFL